MPEQQPGEKGKSNRLSISDQDFVFQNEEREKRAAELIIINKELAFQNEEREKRAAELIIINKELAFQNEEREKRATELIIINKELAFQNEEREKRAAELVIINKELLTFNYISSHDLREPLRKIVTFGKIILDKESHNLSQNGKDNFLRIIAATTKMQQLIDDLLTYSRINDTERKFVDTNLDVILQLIKDDLKENISEKHATIETSKIGTVRIIPFQFRQLMYNLVHNALKFTRPDIPPHIVITSTIVKGNEVSIENLLPGKDYYRIAVKDNGIGFDAQYTELIFNVFQKLNGNSYSGTGIGLAVVKKIVENHDGIIIATSKLNEGALFDIYLPAA